MIIITGAAGFIGSNLITKLNSEGFNDLILVDDFSKKEKENNYKAALDKALQAGYDCLENGETAMEAVEAAIIELENSPLFNAGRGAVFNAKGQHEMDASIMDGKTLHAGAVAAVRNLKNPISALAMICILSRSFIKGVCTNPNSPSYSYFSYYKFYFNL